jgi:hypothetical protein
MQQITRDNHYVPQWYQRGFMANGKHKLHVLNLHPDNKTLPTGQIVVEPEVEELGPKQAFKERDLYTIRWGQLLNDDIETFLFGKIDKNGADAVRGWISGNAIQIHRKFMDFFEYMDAQKLRTPKGLDWILKHFNGLPHVELMRQMQAVRQMHCTMWSECVREIVSAADSPVKFLVSDHPVTVYHPKLSPGAPECAHPDDPGIELVGSQTIFALDKNHCLILTNLEYAEDPQGAAHLSRRTNARFRGDSMARTDAFIRGRKLSEMEVHAVNRILKSRAKRYVGAGNPTWLYPEKHCDIPWEGLGSILLPRRDLWRFGGEIYIGYKDGTTGYRDQFGRTSTAHKFLAKSALKEDPPPDARCGCGSGLSFRDCCADVTPTMRPSWRVMGIRERNLALLNGIRDIFLKDAEKSWLDVRRDLSDDQVRSIHELFAALWPADTKLIDLLPSPQRKRSRALFLGMTDARTVCALVVGMLAYVDEVVAVHPFVNANAMRPEFSPIKQPAQHRNQTLNDVFTMLVLEPFIADGRVHLIPDPLDYDTGFRQEIMTISKQFEGKVTTGPIDTAFADALSKDELMRFIKRLPLQDMKAQLMKMVPKDSTEMTSADLDAVASHLKKELEDDPLALLDPPASSDSGGELRVMKGFSRETGLFIATLTGAFVYTNSDTMWARLHDTDGVHSYESDPASAKAIGCLDGLHIQVPAPLLAHPVQSASADSTRQLLRKISVALRRGEAVDTEAPETDDTDPPKDDSDLRTFKLRASVPMNGFQRTDVSRLVLTFGRLQDVAPVRLAIFLEPVKQTVQPSPEPAL